MRSGQKKANKGSNQNESDTTVVDLSVSLVRELIISTPMWTAMSSPKTLTIAEYKCQPSLDPVCTQLYFFWVKSC